LLPAEHAEEDRTPEVRARRQPFINYSLLRILRVLRALSPACTGEPPFQTVEPTHDAVKNIPITRMRIVRATLNDLPSISELAGVIWRACYPEIITAAQIEYMLAKMYSLEALQLDLRQGVRYGRLLAGEQFVGFAAHGPTDHAHVFKLHKLYLHPDWHGRGCGSLLLQHCQTDALTLGARRLILTVNKRNQKAIATYERNGFATVESIITDIGDGFVMDDYVMAKDL